MDSKLSPDGKVRILLVDDSLHTYLSMMCGLNYGYDEILKTLGLDAEVWMVETPNEALNILQQWKEQGHQADIVSVDYHFGAARRVIDKIVEADEKTPGLLPKKFFVHSKSGLNAGYGDDEVDWTLDTMKEVGADYCHTFEWMFTGACSGGRPSETFRNQATTTSLRDYLRANYPVDENSIIFEKNTKKFRQRASEVYEATAAEAHDKEPDVEEKPSAWELIDQVNDFDISREEAVKKYDASDIKTVASGLRFSGAGEEYDGAAQFSTGTQGAAVGRAAFSPEEVKRFAQEHQRDPKNPDKLAPILVIEHLRPEHVAVLPHVAGVVLLGKGSKHLPILCEGLGIPCIASATEKSLTRTIATYKNGDDRRPMLSIDRETEHSGKEHWEVRSGDVISIQTRIMHGFDGGQHPEGWLHPRQASLERFDISDEYSYAGAIATIAGYGDEVKSQLRWHRKDRTLRDCQGLAVKANADTPEQVETAIKGGAEGIGLLRTEHSFLLGGQIETLQRAMLAEGDARASAIAGFEAAQKKALLPIFEIAARQQKKSGREFPVSIRLLDGKPDELLPDPQDTANIAALAPATGVEAFALTQKITQLRQGNERGDAFVKRQRDLYEAQVRAVFDAAGEAGVTPEIMVPMIRTAEETQELRAMVERISAGRPFRFGVMMETVDAIKNAAAIAPHVQFMSFGTNDLTQEVIGVQRDDMEAIERWKSQNTTQLNPFRTIVPPVADHMREAVNAVQQLENDQDVARRAQRDQEALINRAVKEAREANPKIHFGVCGQHATDRDSVQVFQEMYTHSISVPATERELVQARINTAQIAIEECSKARAAAKSGQVAEGGKISPDNMRRGTVSPGGNTRDVRNEQRGPNEVQ